MCLLECVGLCQTGMLRLEAGLAMQSCSRVGSTRGSGRVGSGPEYFNIRRVGSGPDAGGSGRVHVPGPDLTRHFYAELMRIR